MPVEIYGKMRWLNRPSILIILAVLVVLITRFPFLSAGYGADADAWRVANTAKNISLSGEYSASRFPGYPLQELIYSLVWKGGPLVLNGLSALMCAAGILFFMLCFRHYRGRDFSLAGLALAFVPVVYINSTSAIDYLWAMVFALASVYFLLRRLPILAGIMLGLAIGSRITSLAMIIPGAVILLYDSIGANYRRALARYTLTATIVGGLCFLPVILRYGTEFLTFYRAKYPSLQSIITRAGEGVWGMIGAIALVLSLAFALRTRKKKTENTALPGSVAGKDIVAWILAVVIYSAAFFLLPHESGYLTIALPFIFFLLARFLPRKIFLFFCVSMLLSPFVDIGKSGLGAGAILRDHEGRINQVAFAKQVKENANHLTHRSVVVAGWYLPLIEADLPAGGLEKVEFRYLLDSNSLLQLQSRGYDLYYLPGIREYNLQTRGVDLMLYGAKSLAKIAPPGNN
jgi:hypothetical protein